MIKLLKMKKLNKIQITGLILESLWILWVLYFYFFREVSYKLKAWFGDIYTFTWFYYIAPILYSLLCTALWLYLFDNKRKHYNIIFKIGLIIGGCYGFYYIHILIGQFIYGVQTK